MNKIINRSKKSQAALEFLMTYGWAILVVLVAIGALAYFGVLSPDKFLPSKCTLPAGIACVDFKVDDITTGDEIRVVLRNGMGFDATGLTVRIESPAGTICGTDSAAATLANGAAALTYVVDMDTFVAPAVACPLTLGSKFSGDIVVSYTNADSTLPHTVRGSITGRAE